MSYLKVEALVLVFFRGLLDIHELVNFFWSGKGSSNTLQSAEILVSLLISVEIGCLLALHTVFL